MKKATETVCWQWADPKHFEAHQDDFIRPVGEILEELHGFLPPFQAASKSDKPIVLECELEEPVGRSGLKVVRPEADKKDESFWAFRRGRAIPSHLIFAEKELTRWVCLWGWRKKMASLFIRSIRDAVLHGRSMIPPSPSISYHLP